MKIMGARRFQLRVILFCCIVPISTAGCDFFQGMNGNDSGTLPGDQFAEWEGGPAYYRQWASGVSADQSYFPISVWLQSSANIAAYRAIGINMYVGLYGGPTEAQLTAQVAGSMPVICEQNNVGLSSANSGLIKAWTQVDEPDNAQNGTQDPLTAAEIVARCRTMKSLDSARPVFINFGCGAASDAWYGRGNRTNHPEDYAEYAKGADIVCFDIYPFNTYPSAASAAAWIKAHDDAVAGNPWFVAAGVDKMRAAVANKKPVWAWLECTNINSNAAYKLTPANVKSEAWMAIVHGARGIGYFCHEFNADGSYKMDDAPLHDDAMRLAISAINASIASLAPALNERSVTNGVAVAPSNAGIPVDSMLKRHDGSTYLFAVAMRPGACSATFTLRGFSGGGTVEVIGENRSLSAQDGAFTDSFSDYGVHVYRIANP
jgi:hypothetical protein